MKKQLSYWVFLLALLSCNTLQAKVSNYVGGFCNIGEWSFMPSKSNYSTSFGVAGGAGFLYELQAGPKTGSARFLLDLGVGLQGGTTAFMQSSNAKVALDGILDSDGDKFTYNYILNNRHDKYTDFALQIPLMVGVQYRKFYALAGLKLYAHVATKSHTTGLVTTYGHYEQFEFEDLYDDPANQFFTDLPLSKKERTSLKPDLALSFEVGGRLGFITDAVGFDVPKRKIEYRLAGFFDYGLNDIHSAESLESFKTPTEYSSTGMVDNLEMNDIMRTTDFAESVHSFTIGLKFTILFPMPEEGRCVICSDSYRSLARRHSGSRGMKYEE